MGEPYAETAAGRTESVLRVLGQGAVPADLLPALGDLCRVLRVVADDGVGSPTAPKRHPSQRVADG
eukprot:11031361-Lingulodinium_polyedra.AAC.1